MRAPRSLALGFVALAALVSTSCFDPVHDDDVNALGGEVSGVREGPTHRPGQPCLTCHGGSGPGSPDFEIAGTVYLYRDVPSGGVEGTEIVITDSSTPPKTVTLQSNSVGNFYLEKDRAALFYPLFIELDDSRITDVPKGVKQMITPIGRNAGCAFCHVHNLNPADAKTHMPQVYLNLKP